MAESSYGVAINIIDIHTKEETLLKLGQHMVRINLVMVTNSLLPPNLPTRESMLSTRTMLGCVSSHNIPVKTEPLRGPLMANTLLSIPLAMRRAVFF